MLALIRVFLFWSLILCFHLVRGAEPADSQTDDEIDFKSLIREQFIAYDPDYMAHEAAYGARLDQMAERLVAAQSNGQSLECSHQIFLEAKWLHRYTAHWDRLENTLERLDDSLGDPDQAFAARQSPADGCWGACFEQWFLKLEATIMSLGTLVRNGESPRYEIKEAGFVNTYPKLLAYLQGLLFSEIANTGVDHRGELSSITATISQGLFKVYLRDGMVEHARGPGAEDRYRTLSVAYDFFLRGWQNPKTGYWGAWYRVDGDIYKADDLSVTYHNISYRRGNVEHWPQIIATTRAIRDKPYPYGWLHRGQYNNHNNYDVAKIYRFGWPHVGEEERAHVRKEIQAMLDWSLAESITPEGRFKTDSSFSNSLADEYYFGVSFFDVIGYWQEKKRFWTDQRVEGADAMCCSIKQRLTELGLKSWASRGAMERLEDNCQSC